MRADISHLIVTGVARSGTTALAELLNTHPALCLGVERFKFQYLRARNFDAGLFQRDRFFDFREDDTNLDPAKRPHWQTLYDQIADKWDDATVIGDKVPDMTPILGGFMKANPDFKAIFILRNLRDVGLSWQARADRPRDAWPKGRGFDVACVSWAQQYGMLTTLLQRAPFRQRMLILDYDAMFDPDIPAEAAILRFLDLAPSDAFSATFAKNRAYVAKKSSTRPRKVPPAHETLYKAVHMDVAKSLRRQSRAQMLALAGAA